MSVANADDQFRRELDEQTRCYEQACSVAADIAQRLKQRQDADEPLAQLGELMRAVAEMADTAAQRHQQWKALGSKPSTELHAAYDKHTRTLTHLIQLVATAEEAAIEARNQLRPKLDTAAQSRRVMKSYHDALKM